MAASEESQHGLKFKRKRKKSFLQNAKGFGKKGKFGHGTQLDQDTYDYFIRVLELLRGDFDNPEDKESLVKNALDQTEGSEIDQSSNQVGARLIESLIKLAPPSALPRFMDVFASNLRVVATNRFASHVLQSLIATVAKFALDKFNKNETGKNSLENSDENISEASATEWVLKVAKFALNNLEEFLWDEYANHVIRTVLLSLAGLPPSDTDSNWSASQKQKGSVPVVFSSSFCKLEDEPKQEVIPLPEGFSDVLKDFCKRILSLPQFSELAYTNTTSALLQTLLSALSRVHPKLKKKLIKQLVDQAFCARMTDEDDKKDAEDTPRISPVFTTDASIRLLEAALEYASSKYVTQMYAMCFMGHLIDLATDLATNFCVQRLLASISDKNEFEALFDELAPGMDKIIASGRSGVLLALCQACKRLSAKQGPFIEQLMKALDCYEPADRRPLITPLCVSLCTYGTLKTEEKVAPERPGVLKSKFNLHGSLIVQCMLTFNKPIKIVNSLLEMPGSELKTLMCDTKGCHIMDAFVKSEFVGEKSRERLLHRLLGSYVALACSKHGSRALEALYAVSSLKNQMKIMEELAGRENLVMGTDSGRIIANKWSLDLFRHRKNEWKQLQSQKERTKDMFADIIGPAKS
ncbi:Nucleolar protein 9 [Frankliniella fusca]|uniref:Nucleolar protein 9 n=1 Tax=Frankliniella fusca TaxID=407009 RepID=A0AAE1HCM7_9NEOP|nr:Nucleolar protein 9 [Frankliniella fusca]KAK3923118.1 Nucleolar protein 9 [Frankliniella fusca]